MSNYQANRKEIAGYHCNSPWSLIQVLRVFFIKVLLIAIGILIVWIAFYLPGLFYVAKEIVPGYIISNKGMIELYSPGIGVVEDIYVQEGDYIKTGEALFSIRTKANVSELTNVDVQLLKQQEKQLRELKEQKRHELMLYESNQQGLYGYIDGLGQKANELEKQLSHQEKHLNMSGKRLTELIVLYDNGHVSKKDLQLQEEQMVMLKKGAQTLKGGIMHYQNQQKQLQKGLLQQSVKQQRKIAEIDTAISNLVQKINDIAGIERFIVYATANGTVMALKTKKTAKVTARKPLLSILPEYAMLQACLLVPSRFIGFIKTGQLVSLRYAAFPYQHYGTYYGRIKQQGEFILLPSEDNILAAIDEPVYKVIVELDTEFVNAYGKQWKLQPHMQLEAVVSLAFN